MSNTRKLRPLALGDVKIADTFWAPRQETNRTVGIRHQYRQCKETGRLDAFKLDWKPGQDNPPHIFWDSDIAKWIEAASYSLGTHPDAELQKLVDDAAALVASAQQPDGCLNVHFTVVEPGKRWTNLRDQHELYCAGHLIEGAVAHFQATGSRVLLDALCRYADHIDRTFGPEPGKKKGYPGHEEIELALIKLYHATNNDRYLKLSKYFVDQRGQQPHYYDEEALARGDDPKKYWARTYEYLQAHKPVRDQEEIVGHAVRAMYLLSGMADVAAETTDETLLAACRRLWASAVERKMYVTGSVGSAGWGERFTTDYNLPNETAYAETCAAIGLVFFAHRMLQIEADAKYADAMERALYNGILSGVSLDGTKFFYENPLASEGKHHRQGWFGCACCPPNVARLVASLGSYAYSVAPDGFYVHLYIAGSATAYAAADNSPDVTLTQETSYPWNGDVKLTVRVQEPSRFDLFLRIPGWCRKHLLKVNGKTVAHKMVKGYARVNRTWSNG
ncbi:MAG: glycoside hydrolase family 127 protein, partial [Planctomycetes bacterium]|nr:glycoside hydrolase family 127 protein [Planctomycetota bacterium]